MKNPSQKIPSPKIFTQDIPSRNHTATLHNLFLMSEPIGRFYDLLGVVIKLRRTLEMSRSELAWGWALEKNHPWTLRNDCECSLRCKPSSYPWAELYGCFWRCDRGSRHSDASHSLRNT